MAAIIIIAIIIFIGIIIIDKKSDPSDPLLGLFMQLLSSTNNSMPLFMALSPFE